MAPGWREGLLAQPPGDEHLDTWQVKINQFLQPDRAFRSLGALHPKAKRVWVCLGEAENRSPREEPTTPMKLASIEHKAVDAVTSERQKSFDAHAQIDCFFQADFFEEAVCQLSEESVVFVGVQSCEV